MSFAVSFPGFTLPNVQCSGATSRTSVKQALPQFSGLQPVDTLALSTRTRELPQLDQSRIATLKTRYRHAVRELVAEFDERPLARQYPLVAKALEAFNLKDWQGIPPLTVKGVPDTDDYRTTKGALAIIALEILKELQNAASAEEAFAQTKEVLEQVCQRGLFKFFSLRGSAGYYTHPITVAPMQVQETQNRVYSSLQTGHIMFVGQNGAIQVVAVPPPNALADLIQSDSKASAFIESNKPVKFCFYYGKDTPGAKGFDLAGTVALLREKAEGKHADRISKAWTDVHTILRDVPIDYATHVRAGRLKVVFDKPGADGLSLWDAAEKA